MVLRTRPRRNDEEVLEERLAHCSHEQRAWFHAPLAEAFHSRAIRPPTMRAHARVRSLWGTFISTSAEPEVRGLGPEITPNMVAPSVGE